MTDTWAFLVTVAVLAPALGLSYRPLGDYMARVFESEHHLRVERWIYRATGVDPDADQRWTAYVRSVVAFSAISILFLYLLQRVQTWLPFNQDLPGVEPGQAFNTAVSFVTNTNWQSYSGEVTMGYLTQAAGLAVQNFLSAAVGIAIAVAVIRGFARQQTDGSAISGPTWSGPWCASCCRSLSSGRSS